MVLLPLIHDCHDEVYALVAYEEPLPWQDNTQSTASHRPRGADAMGCTQQSKKWRTGAAKFTPAIANAYTDQSAGKRACHLIVLVQSNSVCKGRTTQTKYGVLLLWELLQRHAHALNGADLSYGVLLIRIGYEVWKSFVLASRFVSALDKHHAAECLGPVRGNELITPVYLIEDSGIMVFRGLYLVEIVTHGFADTPCCLSHVFHPQVVTADRQSA